MYEKKFDCFYDRAEPADTSDFYHMYEQALEMMHSLAYNSLCFSTCPISEGMTPYTPETKNLIGERELSLMKNTSILINTARGGIVNETALYHALKNRVIWAPGLDVFEKEPVPLDHPLLTLPNVVTLPHIGSASIKTRMKMAELAAENLIAAIKNEAPKHLVV